MAFERSGSREVESQRIKLTLDFWKRPLQTIRKLDWVYPS